MFHILKYVWFVFLLVLKNIYQDKNVNLMPLKMSCDVTQEKLTKIKKINKRFLYIFI